MVELGIRSRFKKHQSRDPMMGAFDLRINQNPDCFLATESIVFESTST
jgi:hypothetical protein